MKRTKWYEARNMKKLPNCVILKRIYWKSLEQCQSRWEAETKTKRYTVTEDNVAEVVSMMTGIPVQRVGQTDSQ